MQILWPWRAAVRGAAASWWLGAVLLLAAYPSRAAGPTPLPADHAERMAAGLELFRSEVRPLLLERCSGCHGGKKTEAGLDLTSREGLLQGGDSGAAVVPFQAAASLIFKRMTHAEEPGMPENEPRLPDAVLASIERWIELGAAYDAPLIQKSLIPKNHSAVTDEDRKFWSFMTLARPEPPAVRDADWCAGPLDRFVLAPLEERGLRASPPLDRRRLIRRLYFDVVGLPPAPEEIDAFVNDRAEGAYERLVDRLLASPHMGERWARHWLDVARFAESHGYEQDYDRPYAYHYRDFIIRAFNEDLPYDRFIQWQLAGDELAPQEPLAWMATGFLGAGTHATQITANQAEKERYDELDDMIATTGTAVLGLTIGCSRCHDHKYDPIPSRDYYRLISTFTTAVRSDLELDLQPERTQALAQQWAREHAPLAEALATFEREQLPQRVAAWLPTAGPVDLPWWVIEPESLVSEGQATFSRQSDGSYRVGGPNADFDAYAIEFVIPAGVWKSLRIEALADAELPHGGPGRASNGNFDLTDVRLARAAAGETSPPLTVALQQPRATFEQPSLEIARAIDDDPHSGWAVDPQFGKDHAAALEFVQPLELASPTRLTLTLRFAGNAQHNLGRVRFALSQRSVAPLDGPMVELKVASAVNVALAQPAAERTAEQLAALTAWYQRQDADWQRLHAAVEAHLAVRPQPALTKVMVTSEGLPAIRFHTQGPDFYDTTFILKRGDLHQKQEPATQSFLQVLMRADEGERHWQNEPPPGAKTSFRRAALARWIMDPDRGAGSLAARVIVNRLWQHYFGRGLVASSSDFGAQGDRPTHPELLEYLARYLVDHQWRLKAVHRLILLSRAYQQGDDGLPEKRSIDPENLLLGRRTPRRLEAEAIRDAMLAASGSLDRTMFGPGSLDENQPHRSIYFTIKRSKLIPLMMLFDSPDSLQGLGSRATTTVAPQALALMNNPQIAAYAQALSRRLMPYVGGRPDEALRQGYLVTLGRQPDDEELAESRAFFLAARQSYAAVHQADADPLALADFCRSLFSLNEFVYVE